MDMFMKKTILFFIAAVSVQANLLNTNQICNLICDVGKKPVFCDTDPDPDFLKRNLKCFCAATNALKVLEEIPPCKSLPVFYSILESGILKTNLFKIPIEKGALDITNDFISVDFNSVLSFQIWLHSDLHFGFCRAGSIIFPWLNTIKSNRFIPATIFCRFWWYEGRKYMPAIWEQWYRCWKSEMAKDSTRKNVKNELENEILSLGFYSFPFLCSALQSGDYSLTNVTTRLKSIENGNYKFNDFSTWWETNKLSYTLPECKTTEGLIKELGVYKAKEIIYKDCEIWSKAASDYYNDNVCFSNCWYYYVEDKDNPTLEDIYDAYNKASNNRK